MESTIKELKLWLDVEKQNPDIITNNDPLLLELVTYELADFRIALSKQKVEDPDTRARYTELYTMLDQLLSLRVDKFARGLR